MKDMRISSKIFVLSSLVTLVLIIISSVLLLSKVSEIKQNIVSDEINKLHNLLHSKIVAKKHVGLTNALSISNNGVLKEALITNDRAMAIESLSSISKNFKNYTSFKNVKIHLHTKDTKSFVRVWNLEKYGDDLSSFRGTLLEVKRTKKPLISFEAGRSGLVLRGVTPLTKDGEYIGSLEFIQGLNSVAKSFEKKGLNFLLLMNNSLTSVATKAVNAPSVGDYKLSQKFVNQEFLNSAKTIDFEKLLKNKNISDDKYYYTYEYVKDYSGKKLGIFLVGEDITMVQHSVELAERIVYESIVGMIVLAVLLFLVIFIILKKLVFEKIQDLQNIMHNSISNNDLTIRAEIYSNDELGKIRKSFNTFMDSISKLVLESKSSGHENASVSEQLSSSVASIGKNIDDTSKTIHEVVARNTQLKVVLDESVVSANSTKNDISEAQNILSVAKDKIVSMTNKVIVSSESQNVLSAKLATLSTEAEQVKDVLNIISDIADQTNLLALNAAIEAARAGEHGRGFAVVADEVRKLAEGTQKTLSEINITIQSIVQSINESSSQINENTSEIQQLVEIAESASNSINKSSVIMDKALIAAKDSSKVSSDIVSNIDVVIEDMSSISRHIDINLNSAKEISFASSHLFKLTEALSYRLNQFKTD